MADAPLPPAGPSRGRSNLPKVLVAVAAVAALVVILLVSGVVGGSDDDDGKAADETVPTADQVAQELRDGKILTGSRQAPFAMRFTDDWVQVAPADLRTSDDDPPIAGLRRSDGSGLLTVTLRGPIRGGIGTVEKELPAELERRIPDIQLQRVRRIQVAAGPALYALWTRKKTGAVQSQLIVPVSNRRSFTVDVLLQPGAKDAPVEVGAMLRTFDTAPAT